MRPPRCALTTRAAIPTSAKPAFSVVVERRPRIMAEPTAAARSRSAGCGGRDRILGNYNRQPAPPQRSSIFPSPWEIAFRTGSSYYRCAHPGCTKNWYVKGRPYCGQHAKVHGKGGK